MALKIKKGIILADFSTFKIGGKAQYFCTPKNEKEIIEAIKFAKEKNLPFFVLGGASNVLFSDEGFKGLIIKMQNTRYKIQDTKIVAQAGCPLQKLVQVAAKNSLSGLEWATGIPGTLGGAIFGNAGAFGGEMKDVVEKVKILELINCEFRIKELKNKDCHFGYRESIFKKKKNLIILEATLKLKKGNKKEIQEKMKKFLIQRKEKQPLELPSAGSVFKNVPIKKVPKEIREKFKQKIKNGFLPAALLIEALGFKGKKKGGAQISKKHANFIVNVGKAQAKDVIFLINEIKKKVLKKFKILLEEELQIVS